MWCRHQPALVETDGRICGNLYLLILQISQLHKDLCSGVLDLEKLEDGSSVVGDSHILKGPSDGELN